jgi:hypothetical protein
MMDTNCPPYHSFYAIKTCGTMFHAEKISQKYLKKFLTPTE